MSLSTAEPDMVRPKKKKAKHQATKAKKAKTKAKPAQKSPLRLLREREVYTRLGLRQTRFRQLVRNKDFPAPVSITGGRAIGFIESEVEEYIASRIAARDEVA